MATASSAHSLAVLWMDQLRHLQHSLQTDPQNSQAWRWRIRVKVLTYLVLRYGGDPSLDVKATRTPQQPLPVICDFSASDTARVRTRQVLLVILCRIAEINRFKIDLTAH